MKKIRILKIMGSLVMTLAMVLTMTATALPAFAADTGTISIKYNPDVAGLDSTDFKLYKVGHFVVDNGKSSIVLEDEFSGSGAVLNIDKSADEEAWRAAWLLEAKKLGDWVKGKDLATVWADALDKSPEFQSLKENGAVKEFDNGVYLLVGEEQLVDNERYWTPVPVLISVLNGESKFTIEDLNVKMETWPVIHKHIIKKTWQDDGLSDRRPATVTVDIKNGDAVIDTIEFSDSKGWEYIWYSYQDLDDQWVYTNIDPENPSATGITTGKLNEGNDFSLKYGDDNAMWAAEERLPQTYADGENRYIPIVVRTGDDVNDIESLNIKNVVVLPVSHDPPVLKKVKGDKPKKKLDFEFSLTAVSTTANVEKMPMPEGSDGNVKIIKTIADVQKEFGEIVFRIPGQYVYEIKEINTGAQGYKYDPSVYTLVYDLVEVQTEPGIYSLEMTLNVYKNGEKVDVPVYEFVNTFTDIPQTGDNTNIILPAAIFVGALIILVLFFRKRRKNN